MTDDKTIAVRVLARYASKLPSKLGLLFLTKAAKGIKGGFTIEALEEVLPLLGWSIKSHPVATPLMGEQFGKILHDLGALSKEQSRWHGGNSKNDPLEFFAHTSDETAAVLEAVKKHVKEAPASGPTHIEIDHLYVHGLGHLVRKPNETGLPTLTATRAWLGMQGWTISTPKGDVTFTHKLTYNGRRQDLSEAAPEKVWTFLYKAGLKDAAKAALDSFGQEVVQNVLKPVDQRSLQGTGTCPCCFRNVKLVRGHMIRHGWEVQGQRQIGSYGLSWHSGPCFGVGYEPFEVSAQGTKDFVAKSLRPALAGYEHFHAALVARPAKIVVRKSETEVEQIERDTTEKKYDYKAGAYVSKYDYFLAIQVEEAVQAVESTKRMIAELEARIHAWKLMPLPGT